MTKSKPPEPPPELWMLWNGRGWVCSIDDAPRGETFLVALSEREAVVAAEHQNRLYVPSCYPVRVK